MLQSSVWTLISAFLLCSSLVLGRRDPLPCSRQTSCGTWQDKYIGRHFSTYDEGGTLEDRPVRRLVSVPVMSGFADRMVGSVTAMLFALLSNRAIYFDTQTANGVGNLRPLTDVFTADTVDWAGYQTPEEIMSFLRHVSPANEDADALQQHSFGQIPDVSSSYYVSMVNGWGSENLFNTVLNESASFETVYLVLNRGMTVSIFNDARAKRRLEAMGLSARTTFACLYSYLFRPNAQVLAMFPQEMSVLSDEFALKIGIQIRTGDLANLADTSNRTALEIYQSFFDCAQEIEDTRKQRGQKIVWYFISDSLPLRTAVNQKYGSKALVKTIGIDTSHSAKETYRQGQGSVSAMTYQSIAGEHWFFSLTDFQVISFDSGIGRSAAFLGRHDKDTVYTINKWWDANPPSMGEHRSCGVQDVDEYSAVAATWSLI